MKIFSKNFFYIWRYKYENINYYIQIYKKLKQNIKLNN